MTRSADLDLRFVAPVVFLLVVVVGCGDNPKKSVNGPNPNPSATTELSNDDAMKLARQSLARNDFAAAQSYLNGILIQDPDNLLALEMASEVALRRGDAEAGLSFLNTAISQADPPKKATLSRAADVATVCGRPFESLRYMVQLNEIAPRDTQSKWDLIGLSSMVGMTHIALPPLQFLAQRGKADFEALQVLANPIRVQADESACKISLERCPDDLRAHFGLAQLESLDMKWQSVLDRLEPVLEKHKDFSPAFSLYGRALLESGKYDSISDWQAKLPKDIQDSSQYWVAAGLWAEHNGKPDEAAVAFWQALKNGLMLDPRAMQGLASNLAQLGRTKEAEQVSQQLSAFSVMADALETHLEREGQSQAAAVAVAESMVPLGRIWEAEAWMRLAAELPLNPVKNLRQRYQAIRSQLTVKTPWQLPAHDLAKLVDTTGLPTVNWSKNDSTQRDFANPLASPAGKIRFANAPSTRHTHPPRIHACPKQILQFALSSSPSFVCHPPGGKKRRRSIGVPSKLTRFKLDTVCRWPTWMVIRKPTSCWPTKRPSSGTRALTGPNM